MKTGLILTLLCALLISCSNSRSSQQNSPGPKPLVEDTPWQKEFPAHWWKEVPRDQAKSWEVLPQEAGYKEVVLSKRNELGLLSNFTEAPFVYHGICYPTVEAFWQMMKYPEGANDPRWKWASKWKFTREEVAKMDGYKAKSAGNYANFLMEKNDANWITFEGRVIPFVTETPQEHYNLIWEALIEKLRQNPEIQKVLLATKDLKLIPDHGISDRAPREWHYNKLWMELRKQLQEGTLSLHSDENPELRNCQLEK